MKVLFVCLANVARSQIAEVCFNQITNVHKSERPIHRASSAGTDVASLVFSLPSRKVIDSPYHRSIGFIKTEFGLDISDKDRVQLTLEMVDAADLSIMICDKFLWPTYLKEGEKVRFWDIPDTPGLDLEATYSIWQDVISHVEELVEGLNGPKESM